MYKPTKAARSLGRKRACLYAAGAVAVTAAVATPPASAGDLAHVLSWTQRHVDSQFNR
jgi:hypothetical protein